MEATENTHPYENWLCLSDRQVYVPDITQPPSLYCMARKWVQNLPDDEWIYQPPSIGLPGQAAVAASPAAPEDPPQAPVFKESSEGMYVPEEALRRLKQHWVDVRQFHQRAAAHKHAVQQRLQPYLTQPGVLAGVHGLQGGAMA